MPKDESLVRGVLAVMGKPKQQEEGEGESDVSEGHLAAAEDILAASDANDAEGLARALKSFVEMCNAEYGGEE